VSGSLDDRTAEFADHLHEHFVHPAVIRDGHYVMPTAPGYSIDMHPDSYAELAYPGGAAWRR
jgi:L-fuconate dehydratase